MLDPDPRGEEKLKSGANYYKSRFSTVSTKLAKNWHER
jgi:hypothetical protein